MLRKFSEAEHCDQLCEMRFGISFKLSNLCRYFQLLAVLASCADSPTKLINMESFIDKRVMKSFNSGESDARISNKKSGNKVFCLA